MNDAQLTEQIKARSGLSDADLAQRVEQKKNELHGLLSHTGALHILANEFGIQAKEIYTRKSTIAELVPGMRGFELEGAIVRIYPAKSFEKNGRKGSVGSFLLQDTSGRVRVVLWDEKTTLLSTMHDGDTVMLQSMRLQQRPDGELELHSQPSSRITLSKSSVPYMFLSQVGQAATASVYGTIVAVHDLRFFEQCPQCRKRLQNQGQWVCPVHGPQSPHYGYLLSLVIDDGTATMRVILFAQQADILLGMNSQGVLALRDNPTGLPDIRKQLLGKDVALRCNVQKNDLFSRVELHATAVSVPTADDVLQMLEQMA